MLYIHTGPDLIASCSSMLLLLPAPTCTNAGHASPNLCTLHLWMALTFPHYSSALATLDATCAGGMSPSAIGTNIPLAHVMIQYHSLQLVFLPAISIDIYSTCTRVTVCTVRGVVVKYTTCNFSPQLPVAVPS